MCFRKIESYLLACVRVGWILLIPILCLMYDRRTGVLRPTQGPHNIPNSSQRPRSKSNKLYYFQGYHDSSGKYKKKPPKGMYINHDDVVKLATIDKASKASSKQPVPQTNFLADVDLEINVLHTQVRTHPERGSVTTISLIKHLFFLSFHVELF